MRMSKTREKLKSKASKLRKKYMNKKSMERGSNPRTQYKKGKK